MVYLLDTSVFVTAENDYYRPAICPGYREWVERSNGRGIVYSIQAVFRELLNQDDSLARWAGRLGDKMFLRPDLSVERTHREVRAWAEDKKGQYSRAAASRFMQGADSFLVAHARAHGHAVVTLEKPAPGSRKRILIPDACAALDVKWLGPFDMLEATGARFVLAGP